MKLTLTIDEVVEATGLSQSAVYEELKSGRLVARKRGGTTLVEELKAFIARLPEWKPRGDRK